MSGRRVGGFLASQGQRGFLTIEIRSYKPIGIECFSPAVPAPPPKACGQALNEVPFLERLDTFSRAAVPGQFSLPRAYINEQTKQCAVVIDTKGDPDIASWADLWYAAVAVSSMCVDQGKAGWSVGLGVREQLFIGMIDESPQPTANAA